MSFLPKKNRAKTLTHTPRSVNIKRYTRHWKDRTLRFIREFPIDCDPGKAAVRAGFPDNRASTKGKELLMIPWVWELIQKGCDERWRDVNLKATDITRELKLLAFANLYNYLRVKEDGSVDMDFMALTKDSAAGLVRLVVEYYPQAPIYAKRKTKVKGKRKPSSRQVIGFQKDRAVKRVTVQLADKLEALRMLGDQMGMWNQDEHANVTVGDTISNVVNVLFGKLDRADLDSIIARGEREGYTVRVNEKQPRLPPVLDAERHDDVRQTLAGKEE